MRDDLAPATRVVFVDDDRDNVDAATAHGWVGIHFTKHDGWRDEIELALALPD